MKRRKKKEKGRDNYSIKLSFIKFFKEYVINNFILAGISKLYDYGT